MVEWVLGVEELVVVEEEEVVESLDCTCMRNLGGVSTPNCMFENKDQILDLWPPLAPWWSYNKKRDDQHLHKSHKTLLGPEHM